MRDAKIDCVGVRYILIIINAGGGAASVMRRAWSWADKTIGDQATDRRTQLA